MIDLFHFVHLCCSPVAHVIIDGHEVLIEKKEGGTLWKLSKPVFEGRGEFPQEVHACLALIQHLKWDQGGRIEVDAVTGTLHWTQTITPAALHQEFPRFIQHAEEWAELLTRELMTPLIDRTKL